MHPNAQLIARFYAAFRQKDYATMQACYHPEARFSDPAFPKLKGPEAGLMWQMMLTRGKDLAITYRDIVADDYNGSCTWEATYTFSGRQVHNVIKAEFRFKDSLIFRHDDYFNFYNWASQALGLTGKLLGWTRFLEQKVQTQAANNLREFIEKNQTYTQ